MKKKRMSQRIIFILCFAVAMSVISVAYADHQMKKEKSTAPDC